MKSVSKLTAISLWTVAIICALGALGIVNFLPGAKENVDFVLWGMHIPATQGYVHATYLSFIVLPLSILVLFLIKGNSNINKSTRKILIVLLVLVNIMPLFHIGMRVFGYFFLYELYQPDFDLQ